MPKNTWFTPTWRLILAGRTISGGVDNVTLNAGTGGAVLATDDITSVHYQKVKLVDGTDQGTGLIAGDATNGLDVDVTRVTGTVTTDPSDRAARDVGKVDVAALDQYTPVDVDSGAGTVNALPVTIGVSGASGVFIGGDLANGLDVDVTRLPALVAGTANIGDVDVLTLPALVAGTANIGDVDVLTIAAGDNNIGNVDIVTMPNVTLAAGTNTNEVVGDAAHDAAVAGNPVLVCGAAQAVDDTAPPNRISAESDATRLATDFDGAVFAHPHGPQVWSYHANGSSALTDAAVHAAPGVGLALYVTDIVCSSGAATAMNIFFEEAATTVLGPWYLEAIAGRGVGLHFQTPKKITANTALTVTTSAAIAHSVDVTGFTAQG